MSEQTSNVFYLSGLDVQDTNSSDQKLVKYISGRQIYEGQIYEHYLNNGRLLVKVETIDIEKGLTFAKPIVGPLFNKLGGLQVHVEDLTNIN